MVINFMKKEFYFWAVQKQILEQFIDDHTDQFQDLHILCALDENPTCDLSHYIEVWGQASERILSPPKPFMKHTNILSI